MGKIKFGIRIPFSGPASSTERLRESAQLAEELGFDAVYAQDHIHKSFERGRISPVGQGSADDPSNNPEPTMFESMTSLAYLAGVTHKIELGVGVTPLPLRDPVIFAKQLATVDAHAGGRAILGVGVANVTDKEEFANLGVPFLPYAERYEQVGEYIAAMRVIWEDPTSSFHGKYVNFDDLVIYPKPARRIPVLIGCKTLAGGLDYPPVKFAVAHADGVMPPFLTTPDDVRTMIREFTDSAAEVGRDVSDFAWCIQRRMSIGETMEEAMANSEWVAKEQSSMWQHAGYMRGLGEQGFARSVEMMTRGTPTEITAMIQEYVDAGANDFDLAFAFRTYDNLLKQMRLFAATVLPAFN